ncbi:MAG: endolytic transglycosylase MltG, partial [Bacteroidia bacterium]|nr:endolytic transglycosylase MltG [Bacteroidia bacterium]
MKLKTKGPLFWIILSIGLFIVGSLYVMLLKSPCDLKKTAYLNVYPGDTQEKVLEQLQKVGKVHSTKQLVFLLNLVDYKDHINPGQYALKPGVTPFHIVRVLRSGLQTPVHLTFNNMRTVEELAGRLSTQLSSDSLTLLNCFRETAWRDSLQLTANDYMCVFIPDTYEVWWNISPEKLRGKFVKAWNYFWDETRLKEASKIGLTKAQVSTLASIVEEETKQTDEMPKVAGLYL